MGQSYLPPFSLYLPEDFPFDDLQIAVLSPLKFFQGRKNEDGWMGHLCTMNFTDMKMIGSNLNNNRILQLEEIYNDHLVLLPPKSSQDCKDYFLVT